jgi:hypothetical protein
MADLLDIMQKLDDDEYKLTTLGFDHVLKLQKFLIFHCFKPVDCVSCRDSPTVSSMTLIICERIANMYDCLATRITPGGVSFNKLSGEYEPTDKLIEPSGPKRFRHGILQGPCNPELFSPEFRAEYSVEEQLHMIRVLAKVQTKNTRQFLARFAELKQSQRSQARLAKVEMLDERISDAAASIDKAFDAMLQHHLGNHSACPHE